MSAKNKTGIELIADERARQITQEGWTLEHDRQHENAELYFAAKAYYHAPRYAYPPGNPPTVWPWASSWWKPSETPARDAVKAGALVQAEIERLEWVKQEIADEIDRLQRATHA